MRTVVTLSLFVLCVFLLPACSRSPVTDTADFYETIKLMEQRQTEILEKQKQIQDLFTAYNQTVGKEYCLNVSFTAFPIPAKDWETLRRQMTDELDPSCRALLAEINTLYENALEDIDEYHALSERLPTPFTASGESHYAMCAQYLKEVYGFENAAIEKILSNVPFQSKLEEGSTVWFLYSDGEFATHASTASDFQHVLVNDASGRRQMLIGSVPVTK